MQTSGRLQVVDGSLYFSPNSTSTLTTIPAEDPGGSDTRAIFLPTKQELQSLSFRERMDSVHTPRWWNLAWGWTAYIPIRPHYRRGFNPVNGLITQYRSRQRHGTFSLGAGIPKYLSMERELDEMTHQLCLQLQISLLRPCAPSMFGFGERYAIEEDLRTAVVQSREWFDVWVGLFCHLIAEMEEEQVRLRGFPEIAIQHWIEVLVAGGHQRKVVQEMNTELVCTFDKSIKRVGTFIDLESTKIHDTKAFVRRLEEHGVPVWYRWQPKYAKNEFLWELGPDTEEVQDWIARSVPSPVRSPSPYNREHRLPPSRKGDVHPVLEIFRKRHEQNARRERHETQEERQKRLHREQNPPQKSAVVIIWDEDENGEWKPETVSLWERRDTLADLKSYQKQYDSFRNEWHCCYALPRPDSYEGYSSEEEDEYGPYADTTSHTGVGNDNREEEIVVQEEIQHTQSENERFELSVEDMDDLAAIQNGSSSALTTDADAAEDYIMQAMRLYYGYTTPLPLPTNDQKELELRAQNRFLKFVGVPLTRVDRALFEKPTIKCAVNFMERLGSGGEIDEGEHDAHLGHRESLVGNGRLKMMKVIKDGETGQEYYIFDDGDLGRTRWMLGVLTATHALLVCRLPSEMSMDEVASFLVNHGIPMQTFRQKSSVLKVPSLQRSTRLIPYRTKEHKFDAEDYLAYITAVENMLGEKRVKRAALMGGGFVWRVAKVMSSADVVLEGPIGVRDNEEDMLVVRDNKSGVEYIDDAMSGLEGDLLCGMVESFTGRKKLGGIPPSTRTRGITASEPLTVINVERNKRYRFRLVNVACSPNYRFSIDGHSLTIIEVETVNVQPYSVTSIQIFAGQRYSFVLNTHNQIGNYWIRANPNLGTRGHDGGLNSAILRYVGAPIADPTTIDDGGSPMLEGNLQPLTNQAAPRIPQPGAADVNINLNVGFAGGLFNVNGAAFHPPTLPVLLQLINGAPPSGLLPTGSVYVLPPNKVIEISMPGGGPGAPHPIHLHGHTFDVVRVAGSSQYNYGNPPKRDVVSIGAAGDNVTIRFQTDNAGPWIMHCHIDWHFENGLSVIFAEDTTTVSAMDPPTSWDNLCPNYKAFGPEFPV
ncbi:hypothetical protein CVT24_001600 [Panaeolus cyanescens]|uniref:laccase n=1 Tax=Panaeolus cyanescens TaxID=181874 RepID=A0A409YFD7_9AGAR|nr:hypothetical protein CVT24_001600 [Panaeolus cyanescens]